MRRPCKQRIPGIQITLAKQSQEALSRNCMAFVHLRRFAFGENSIQKKSLRGR